MRSIFVDGKKFAELKHSKREVENIVKRFQKHHKKGMGYYYREAGEGNFRKNIGGYRYVHVATHGLLNKEQPALSGIIFSQSPDSEASEDGIFYTPDSYNLDIDADLLVLSSCESGIGKWIKGEGILALTRGFLYAGVPNITISLWQVYDEHTGKLMIAFYENILAGAGYAEALQKAKLAMLQNEATAHPSKWGAFVLIGR